MATKQPDDPIQKIGERVLIAAMKFIHNPRITEKILRIMRAIKDPAAAIAQASIIVMKALTSKAKGMPLQIILPVLSKIIQEVAAVGEAAKLVAVTPEILRRVEQIITEQIQRGPQQPARSAQESGAMPAGIPAGMPPPQMQGGLIGSRMQNQNQMMGG